MFSKQLTLAALAISAWTSLAFAENSPCLELQKNLHGKYTAAIHYKNGHRSGVNENAEADFRIQADGSLVLMMPVTSSYPNPILFKDIVFHGKAACQLEISDLVLVSTLIDAPKDNYTFDAVLDDDVYFDMSLFKAQN
jgi:hypothetical protein